MRYLLVVVLFACPVAVAEDDISDLYRQAAEAGNANSQAILGRLYYFGHFVPQDYEQAAYWFTEAANQGHIDAQIDLGMMYITGQGVLNDYVQAYKWLDIAASSGNDHAAEGRDAIRDRMSQEQIEQAERLSREWQPASAEDVFP